MAEYNVIVGVYDLDKKDYIQRIPITVEANSPGVAYSKARQEVRNNGRKYGLTITNKTPAYLGIIKE